MKTLDQVINQLKEITNNPTEYDLENEGYYLAKDCLYYLLELQHIEYNNCSMMKKWTNIDEDQEKK